MEIDQNEVFINFRNNHCFHNDSTIYKCSFKMLKTDILHQALQPAKHFVICYYRIIADVLKVLIEI